MWNRVEVKAKGKAGFKRNYWNCVVVSLLFTLVSGGLSGNEQRVTRQIEENYVDPAALLEFITTPKVIGGAAVGLVIGILVFGALEVGCSRFFLLNQLQPASVSEMGYGFSHNYGNNVGTILLRNVFVILGVILFIIPGVIMSYQYRMVPYILSEKPELGPKGVGLFQENDGGSQIECVHLRLLLYRLDSAVDVHPGHRGNFLCEPVQVCIGCRAVPGHPFRRNQDPGHFGGAGRCPCEYV